MTDTTTKFAWLIERADSDVSKPLYWKGTFTGDNIEAWTFDSLNAIRFADGDSALIVSMNCMGRGENKIRCRVAEHGWKP